MKEIFNNILRKNFYLLLAGTWLITISFILHYWSQYHSSTQKFADRIGRALQVKEKDFLTLTANTPLIGSLVNGEYSDAVQKEIAEKPYHIFLYRYDINGNLQLQFWNTQTIQPDWQMLYADENRLLMKYMNGDYEQIRRTVISRGTKIVAIALLPIKKEYFVENDYLRNDFVDAPGTNNQKKYIISIDKGDEPVKSYLGNTLFYISRQTGVIEQDESSLSLFLRLAGLFLLMAWVYGLTISVEEQYGKISAFSLLVFFLLLVRALFYYRVFPFNFRQYELFDTAIYSSGIFFFSLGDFIVNVLCLIWLIVYANRLLVQENGNNYFARPSSRYIALLPTALLFCVVTLLCAYLITTLVSDSKISYDVTNFFSLNIYSFVGFLVMGMISLVFFYTTRLLFYWFDNVIKSSKIFFYVAVAICGLAYLSFRTNAGDARLELFILCWLIIFLIINNYFKTVSVLHVKGLSGSLFWVFIFSATLSGIVLLENNRVSLQQKKLLAENLAAQSDPENETLLNIAFSNFSTSFFQDNFDRFRNDSVAQLIKDSLIKDIFKGYLNKYDTRIYVYDVSGKPLKGIEEVSLDTLNTIITNQARRTKIAGLYYYESSFDQYSYLSKKDLRDTAGGLMGYVFIQSKPKRYKTDALYPELFKQRSQELQDKSSAYTYAVYDKMTMYDHNNDYPFPATLNKDDLPKTIFEVRDKGAFIELWHKANNNKVIIIAEPDTGLMNWVSLFAYLFCAFLITLFFTYLIFSLFRTKFRWGQFKSALQLNIRTQIQGTIILASIVSFVVIGVVTINFFTTRYDRNTRERLSRTISIMRDEVQNEVLKHKPFDDVLHIYDEGVNQELQRKVEDMSEIHHADINLYDPEGNLKVSSQPFVYTRGILSEKMNPFAFYHLKMQREVQFIQKEQVGYLEYTSIYMPVRDDEGQIYAFLNIPYFSSQSELKQEISNFLITIINLNAFIFLVAGAFAFFITNRITDSFSLISEKMKAVNLGKVNEEITWKKDDEIGDLVKEYNKMVHKLEESAEVLARNEREGAWREMARQVAHEIKNPLTPMKLSIQYLQKAVNENSGNVKELSANVANTLVEQIDHLSKIAADFSQFANIGNPRNEKFDLHEMLYSLSQLYSTNNKVKFEWMPVNHVVNINADRTQINRLFTNLLQNAVQALPEDGSGEVMITEKTEDGNILIAVSDNGQGIDESLRSRIFTPNFTTKTSGTGLGLAMTKGIVEQSGGKIWFETELNKGTIFYVSLPLA